MSASEIRVVEDVPNAFLGILHEELTLYGGDPTRAPERFRLCLSGGASGRACTEASAADNKIDWSRMALFLADERCVEETSPDSNIKMFREVLAAHLDEIELHPMSCDAGPAAYQSELEAAGGLDLLQLGFGPDGHVASLFPRSEGLGAAEDHLVVENRDPLGHNPFPRLSLTYAGIARSSVVVIVVMGGEKREAFAAIASGEDLPAARVRAEKVIWLTEPIVAADLDLTRFTAPQ